MKDISDAEMLGKIIDGSPIPSFVINNHHIVTHWNTAIEALTGSRKEDVLGTDSQWMKFYEKKRPTLADLMVDGACEDVIDIFYQGKCDRSSLLPDAYEAEDFFPALGTNGKWVHLTASPLREGGGKAIGAIETVQDITETRLAQYSLRRTERALRKLFENAVDTLWVHDLQGNFILVNKACERLTGYTERELLSRNARDFLDEESREIARSVRRRILAGEDFVQPYEQRLKTKDGTFRTVKMSTALVTDNGEPAGFQHSARDMTDEIEMGEKIRFYLRQVLVAQEDERKRIARELHDDTAQLLGSLSRQIDNFIRDKKRKSASADAAFLKDLQAQLNRGVQDVHRFSQALRLSILDDLGLIPALRSLMRDLEQTGGVMAELQVTGEERRYSAEVETMLFRIVQEATTNIRRHAHASKARVLLDFAEDELVVSVSDNGQGFEFTNDAHDFLTTGKLGLAGIEERVHLLSGSLDVQSSPGCGTTLTITVPNSLVASL